MDAVKYVKTQFRLCRSKDSCSECPLQDKENCCCITDTIEYVEKAVQIVEEWAKDNPEKTRKSEFLKMFPNADMQKIYTLFPCVMDQTIRPTRCVKYESFSSSKKCVECRKDYWNEEVTDND